MGSVYVCVNCTDVTTKEEDVFATNIEINDEVTFAKIIATIFIPTFPHCVPEDHRDGWGLCPTCATILTQLYKHYQDFVNLTKEEGLLYGAYIDKKNQNKVPKSSPNSSPLTSPHPLTDPVLGERLPNPEIYVDNCIIKSEPVESSWENFINEEDEDPLQFDSDHSAFVNSVIINPERVKRKRGRPPKKKVCKPKPLQIPVSGKRRPGRPRKVISTPVKEETITESCPPSDGNDENSSQNRTRAGRFVKKVKVVESSEDEEEDYDASSRSENEWENSPQDKTSSSSDEETNETENYTEETTPSSRPNSKRHRGPPTNYEFTLLPNSTTKLYKCPISGCSKTAKTTSNITIHVRCVHHQEKPFRCPTCGKGFFAQSTFRRHAASHHPGAVVAVVKSPSPPSRRRRPRTKHVPLAPPTPRKKRGCRPDYDTQLMDDDTLLYKCPIPGCSKTAKLASNITIHVRCVHKLERPFKCGACPKRFFARTSLRLHTARFHSVEDNGSPPIRPPTPTRHPCDHPGCGKSFPFPSTLAIHRFDHADPAEFPFSCEICGARFKRGSGLKDHMPRHSENREWMCDQCGGAFKSKMALQKHTKTKHSEADVKTCEICGKRLSNPFNLRVHIKSVHEGVKRMRRKKGEEDGDKDGRDEAGLDRVL